jgi:hypothetical protein
MENISHPHCYMSSQSTSCASLSSTYFFYSDDLNSENSYESLRSMYSSTFTSPSFHPAQSVWVNCQAYIYLPHSNECGPRSLLAASIMAFHPSPSSSMILPFMHNNICQISMWWVAKSILMSKVDPLPLQMLFHTIPAHHPTMSHHRESHPANLAPISFPYILPTFQFIPMIRHITR